MKVLKTIELKVSSKNLYNKIPLVQADSGRSIDFVIVDMTIPSDATARFYALKPDGSEVYNNCTIKNNTITVNLTTQTLAVIGLVSCQVCITSGSDIVTTFEFGLKVERSLRSASSMLSSNEFGALDEALKMVDGLENSISKVNENLENLFPGGTNILRNTNADIALTSTGVWSAGTWRTSSIGTGKRERLTITDAPNPDVVHGWGITSTSGNIGIRQDITLPLGCEYTMSCYARTNNNGTLRLYAYASSYTSQYQTRALTTEWKKYYFTSMTAANAYQFQFECLGAGNVQICGMKLELGNKATDWSPSPWDIAKQSEVDELNENLENLFPGGTNILRNTNTGTEITASGTWSAGAWRYSGTAATGSAQIIAITDAPNPDIGYGYRVTKVSTAGDCGIRQYTIHLDTNCTYIMSCYARLISGDPYFKLMQGTSASGWVQKELTLTEGWQKYSFIVNPKVNLIDIIFGIVGTRINIIEFCGMKLEVGNKATDWSPSPWDIAHGIQTGTATNSEYIKSGSLTYKIRNGVCSFYFQGSIYWENLPTTDVFTTLFSGLPVTAHSRQTCGMQVYKSSSVNIASNILQTFAGTIATNNRNSQMSGQITSTETVYISCTYLVA